MPRNAGWRNFWSAWSLSTAACCDNSWTRCSRWWWHHDHPRLLYFSSQTSMGRRYRWGTFCHCPCHIVGSKKAGGKEWAGRGWAWGGGGGDRVAFCEIDVNPVFLQTFYWVRMGENEPLLPVKLTWIHSCFFVRQFRSAEKSDLSEVCW